MQVELGLAWVTHRDPPEILAEPDVVPGLKAQDVGVEGEGFVEIGDPDTDERRS